jgi:hypothetical protein
MFQSLQWHFIIFFAKPYPYFCEAVLEIVTCQIDLQFLSSIKL